MSRFPRLLAAVLTLALALAPTLADARAGGGSSMGSRGGRTYSAPPPTNTAPYSAAPMERSMTPRTAPSPGYAAPGAGSYGYANRSPFMSGLLGGLIGAGLGGLLLGHGLFGGISGIGGFLGFLVQILLLVLLARFLLRWFMSRRQPALAGSAGGLGNIFARRAGNGVPPPGGGNGGAAPSVAIQPQDYQAFERVLRTVQAAWSGQDLNALRAVATPEMVGYFSEQISGLSSRGLRNTVTDVRLEKGDLAEAWTEGGRDYATVAMRFSMIDVTRDASGRVVDGNPGERTAATEIWTFLRGRGGQWVLSAIQQGR